MDELELFTNELKYCAIVMQLLFAGHDETLDIGMIYCTSVSESLFLEVESGRRERKIRMIIAYNLGFILSSQNQIKLCS